MKEVIEFREDIETNLRISEINMISYAEECGLKVDITSRELKVFNKGMYALYERGNFSYRYRDDMTKYIHDSLNNYLEVGTKRPVNVWMFIDGVLDYDLFKETIAADEQDDTKIFYKKKK